MEQQYTRKLVTIQQITAITDIPGADLIALATIQGWQVIVKKTEFSVGDACLFFEIDSFLPLEPRYEFLKKTTKFDGKEGYRLKSMKMRSCLSQGLALPLSMFPEITNPKEDFDYAEKLGVIKYDNEIQAYSGKPGLKSGKARGNFPTFLPKTDQPRIQNLTTYFSTLVDEEFEETLKLDGCFLSSQYIETWDGTTVTIGDIVNKGIRPTLIGVDPITKKVVPSIITDVFKNGTKKEWLDILYKPYKETQVVGKSGRIRTTPNHLFFTETLEEKEASTLSTSDTLLMQTEDLNEAGVHYIRSGLLGDGSLGTNGHYSYNEAHVTKVDAYNNYIQSLFPSNKTSTRVQISGYGSEVRYTKVFKTEILKALREEWYPDTKKCVPKDIDWIDDFTIAKWYMDDGSLAHNSTQNDRALFATNSFTEEDTNRLADKLRNLYKVDVTVYHSKGWCIRVNYSKGSINRLWEAIAPYIHDCFLYKLPEKFRNRIFKDYPKIAYIKKLVPVQVLDVQKVEFTKKNFSSGAIGYDIETTTHNYFCGGLLVHNSSMTCYKIIHTPTLWERVKAIFGIKHKAYHFGVCSRNLELKPTANNKLVFDNQGKESIYDQSDFWTAAYKYKLEDKLQIGYAIQGELIGPKIQDNQEKVKELEFYCFDVYNIYTGDYLTPVERREFCATHNIPHVPVISEQAKPLQLGLEGLLKHVEGESMNPGTISEGRVYKHISKPITFKAISNKYLLGSEQ